MNNHLPPFFQDLNAPLLIPAAQSGTRETDCACADRPSNVTCAVSRTPPDAPYVQVPGAFTAALPHGFHAVMSPTAPHGPSVVNAAGWERWQQFGAPRAVAHDFDRQLAAQELIRPLGASPQLHEPEPATLTAWLHVTNACNLDCPYCYVRKSSSAMSRETGLLAVRRIFAAAVQEGFDRVKLKYAGGEASLQFGLVRALHDVAAAHAQTHGVRVSEVVLTNGTLLRPAEADWCGDAGVQLMISLDGVGETHDRMRPWRKGGGSFAHVQRTVDEVLLPRDIHPYISMTVTGANAHGAADVVRWALIERGLPLNLNFYRANVLSESRADLALDEGRIIAGLLAAYQVIEENLPATPFIDGLIDRGHSAAHTHTCGAGRNYVVIDHTGRVSQCQMHLGQGETLLRDGSLIPAQHSLINLAVDQKEGCRDCAFRYRCTGGCPVETFRATGRWDVQSPNCGIYRALWPAALRLEGLRLMKERGLLN